jgi:hypothetical protein
VGAIRLREAQVVVHLAGAIAMTTAADAFRCLAIVAWLAAGSIVLADEDDDGSDAHDKGEQDKIEVLFQELFLGEVVFPQDKGELQVSAGLWHGLDARRDSTLPLIVQYGITDRLEVGAWIPVDFRRTYGAANGLGNIELDGYWNVLNDPRTGWASGVGFGLGLPNATSQVGDRALSYQPFWVLCRERNEAGFNLSAAVDVKDPLDGQERNDVTGNLDFALFKKFGRFVPLLELGAEVDRQRTAVRLAPGLYWHPAWTNAEIGVSVPIGLTRDTPTLGGCLLITWEFEHHGQKNSPDD